MRGKDVEPAERMWFFLSHDEKPGILLEMRVPEECGGEQSFLSGKQEHCHLICQYKVPSLFFRGIWSLILRYKHDYDLRVATQQE